MKQKRILQQGRRASKILPVDCGKDFADERGFILYNRSSHIFSSWN